MQSPLLDAALAYAARGWLVFPAHSIGANGRCSCADDCGKNAGKHPRVMWKTEATTDREIISAWWRRWPESNVAIVTGGQSGLVVFDVDSDKGGDASLAAVEERFGETPTTPTVRTGGGGLHFYCSHPGATIANGSALAGYPGLDLRADGGYVIAPPSNHRSGGTYRWDASLPSDLPLAAVPRWIIECKADRERTGGGTVFDFAPRGWDGEDPPWLPLVLEADASIRRRFERDATGLADTSASGVDLSLASLAAIRGGLDGAQLEILLRASRGRAGLKPEGVSHYRTTIGKALGAAQERKERREQRGRPEVDEPASPTSDVANALRLAQHFGDDMRWVSGLDWIIWTGARWERARQPLSIAPHASAGSFTAKQSTSASRRRPQAASRHASGSRSKRRRCTSGRVTASESRASALP